MTDVTTVCSKSTFDTTDMEVLGCGGQLSPGDESSKLLQSHESWKDLDGSHMVTCTLTVSLAVPTLPTEQKQKKSNPADKRGKGIQVDKSRAVPRTQRCYQIEYFLLPDELGPRKLDLVLVGAAAKLHTKSGSKAITPWLEDDKMWLSWNHSVDIHVTSEYLIKLRDHKIIVNIWDAKDKVSSKAKVTNSKVTSSQERVEAVDEVNHTVLLQRKSFEESQPAPSCTKIKAAKKSKAQETSALHVEASYSVQPCLPSTGRRGSGSKRKIDAPQAKKNNIASLQFDLMPLLAGEKTVTSRLTENSPKVLDVYVTFAVETPLLSERQRHELNPLVIRIHSATCLPNTPVPIEELQRMCVPIYCKYKFHNFPPHRTHGQVHGTHVYFKDVNVILTGLMGPGELQKCLRGPPLEVEVHDRDRNMRNDTEKPCLSGKGGEDEELGKVHLLACKSTVCNSSTEDEVWYPHGVAKVSLTELLLGRKYLNINAPIHSCSAPNTAASSEEDKAKRTTESVRSSTLLHMGHYLESDSLLKVRVEMSVPLAAHAQVADAHVTNCPFGCIIYSFDYNNSSLLHELVEEITEINAQALQLDCYPVHFMGMALAASKLQTTLEEVSELDIVTGFHLLDGETHLFVLEGLKDKAIKKLWDRHFERTHRSEDGQLKILYNSQLSFRQRLYTDLEGLFYHCCLQQPLRALAKQPLLYVRGAVPWALFQALSRLSYLRRCKRLRDVVQGKLLPSAEMITALSHEYGAPLAIKDLLAWKPPLHLVSSGGFTVPGTVSRAQQAAHSSLGNRDETWVQRKKERADNVSFERNSLGTNSGAGCQLKGKMEKPKFEAFRISPIDGKSVFNYSSQTLNSAELAKQQLRQEMAKEPKKRFTYCHEFLLATFEPVDVAAAQKEASAKSKSMWLSPDGFVFPGFKSRMESNLHPWMPDEARVEELSEKWQENALHANTEPALARGRWSRGKRDIDFDLYKKPPELFMTTAPRTDAAWILHTLFDALKLQSRRCCSAAARGPRASAQQQKLLKLLRDEAQKSSLRKAGPVLKVKGNVPGVLTSAPTTVQPHLPCTLGRADAM
ncbi:uncharacterized protein CFAP92 [Phaenicophaeus curvirostris]|uniref:uncharacterized protein CFAP92 n=1 Tax=Phaenicophaeus curvirostris TaxID=33595 RepID=UPI0037F0DE5D